MSLFDTCTITALLKCIRSTSLGPPIVNEKSSTIKGQGLSPVAGDLSVEHGAIQHIMDAIQCVCQFLGRVGLREQPELVREFAETCSELCRSSVVAGGPSSTQFCCCMAHRDVAVHSQNDSIISAYQGVLFHNLICLSIDVKEVRCNGQSACSIDRYATMTEAYFL